MRANGDARLRKIRRPTTGARRPKNAAAGWIDGSNGSAQCRDGFRSNSTWHALHSCRASVHSSICTPESPIARVHSTMTHSLLLIRHGQIAANAGGRWHGATDSPLTRTGRRQAARVAQCVRARWGDIAAHLFEPDDPVPDTAQAIGNALSQPVINVDDDLREYGIGELEDTTFAALQSEHDFFRRIKEDPDFAPPGGDSINAVARRIVPALQRIYAIDDSARPIAVVSHGAALAIALATLLDADANHWTNYHVDNCSVTELLLEPEPLIAAFNSTEHL